MEGGAMVLGFGKYSGKSIAEVAALGNSGMGYVRWLAKEAFKPEVKAAAIAFLSSPEIVAAADAAKKKVAGAVDGVVSSHLGKVSKPIDLHLKVLRIKDCGESSYRPAMPRGGYNEAAYYSGRMSVPHYKIYTMIDRKGNVVVYKGTSSLDVHVDDIIKMTATVKEHKEYNGVNQTVVSRPRGVVVELTAYHGAHVAEYVEKCRIEKYLNSLAATPRMNRSDSPWAD